MTKDLTSTGNLIKFMFFCYFVLAAYSIGYQNGRHHEFCHVVNIARSGGIEVNAPEAVWCGNE